MTTCAVSKKGRPPLCIGHCELGPRLEFTTQTLLSTHLPQSLGGITESGEGQLLKYMFEGTLGRQSANTDVVRASRGGSQRPRKEAVEDTELSEEEMPQRI